MSTSTHTQTPIANKSTQTFQENAQRSATCPTTLAVEISRCARAVPFAKVMQRSRVLLSFCRHCAERPGASRVHLDDSGVVYRQVASGGLNKYIDTAFYILANISPLYRVSCVASQQLGVLLVCRARNDCRAHAASADNDYHPRSV